MTATGSSVQPLKEHGMDYRTAFIASRRITWFELCCESLKDQINDNCVLYLDGPISDKNISQNLETYKRHFPKGEVVHSTYENYQPLLAWILLDNFKNPKSELLLLVEDDLLFSHNYIEQLKVLYDHTKDNDKFISWSCWSRESLPLSIEELSANKRSVIWQHNHIGSMIDIKALKKIGEDHLSFFLQQCSGSLDIQSGVVSRQAYTQALPSIMEYMRKHMDYRDLIDPKHPHHGYSIEAAGTPLKFQTSIGIDGFYNGGIMECVGRKYRAATVYNKLLHAGWEGKNDVHGCPRGFYDGQWHKLKFIEDFVPSLDTVDEDYFHERLMDRVDRALIRTIEDYHKWSDWRRLKHSPWKRS
jgi:hypothetical protein